MQANEVTPLPRSERKLICLGTLCAVGGIGLYVAQLLAAGRTDGPWYMPVLATAGAGLVLIGTLQRPTWLRGIALVLVAGLAVMQWWFLLRYVRLPEYDGPVTAGQSFPEFQAKRADGATFAQADLAGRPTALIFFRGHW
jgi:hypothetical protein